MIDISKYSEEIQKYLADELTKDELASFENLIRNHSELQNEIQLYRKVSGAISDPALENFKKKLEVIHNQSFGTKVIMKNQSNRWYLLAASFVILIAIGSIFIFQSNEVNSLDVFAKYYQPLENSCSRGVGDDVKIFSQAINNYNRNNFVLAFEQFKRITEIEHDNYSARLYTGVCGIELNKFDVAEIQFVTIIESKDPFFAQDAEWYLALLYLKMDKSIEAKSIFKKIYDRGGVFAKNASLVLDDLN